MGSRRDFLKTSAALGMATAGGGCASIMPAQSADTLIVNARIATLDPRRPSAEAIAIKGERILAAGPMPALASHEHPMIIGDSGAWSMECPCGAL